MKFTLSWLKQHLQTKASLDEIVEKLTLIGLEVEEVVDAAARLKNFAVAEIIATEPHPDADRLQVCTVKTARGQQRLVCGAPNARIGMKGILAEVGAVIPTNDMVLKKAKIRGVESDGMMCSAAELGLSDDHDTIIELGDDMRVGMSAAQALRLDDPMIEIAVTPNRPDCLGVRGIARDLAAAGLGTLKQEKIPVLVAGDGRRGVAVTGAVCPYFTGCTIEGVANGKSPEWLQARLRGIGLKPISALVDVTNYIAYDRGQPMHVYDADTLTGTVSARMAKASESFTALDGNDYKLTPEDCVIGDEKGVIGLGGVMGGLASGSTAATKNVFVECAWFQPVPIALSGRRHRIESDSRYRYERGVDPKGVDCAMDLAVQMITEICGGTPKGRVTAGGVPSLQNTISFDPQLVETLGGLSLPDKDKQAILEKLGFQVKTGKKWKVTVPSWRPDIATDNQGAPDLVEEIARIYGLDNLPAAPLPKRHDVTRPVLSVAQRRTGLIRRTLAGRGLVEAVTWSFIGAAEAEIFGVADGLELENPISAELSVMRPSLLPGLLAAAARNVDRGFADVALFELGHEFLAATPGAQRLAVAGVRVGHIKPRRWQGAPQAVTAYDARGDAQAALAICGVDPSTLQILPPDSDVYHPGRAGLLARNPRELMAAFGELHPVVAKHFGLSGTIAVFEVWPESVRGRKASDATKPALALHNLQPVRRDFAFEMPRHVAANDVVKVVRGADKKLIAAVRVFDLYEGENIAEGMKSLALEVSLQPVDTTFTDAEIDAVALKITAAVEKATGGKLRG